MSNAREMISKLKALDAQIAELLEKMQTVPEGEGEGLKHRISEIQDEKCRVMGLSEAEIAEIKAEAKAQTKEQIQLRLKRPSKHSKKPSPANREPAQGATFPVFSPDLSGYDGFGIKSASVVPPVRGRAVQSTKSLIRVVQTFIASSRS